MKLDKCLLIKLRDGDEKAFESLFWKYNEHIYNFILSIFHDDFTSEDITQNVFLKIWERRESIDIDLNFESYIFTIARNLAYKEMELRLVSQKLSDAIAEKLVDENLLMEERIDSESLREYIHGLVEELPDARRRIFQLSRYEHLSNKEIATRLSISEKTVETQMTRALRFLRPRLSSDGMLCLLIAFPIALTD